MKPYYYSVQNSAVLPISHIGKAEAFTRNYQAPLRSLHHLECKDCRGGEWEMKPEIIDKSSRVSLLQTHQPYSPLVILPHMQVALF